MARSVAELILELEALTEASIFPSTRSGWIDQILARESWTRVELEELLSDAILEDQVAAEKEELLARSGRIYGGYFDRINGIDLNIARSGRSWILWPELVDLFRSLEARPTCAKYWTMLLFAGDVYSCTLLAKLLGESELQMPLCFADCLAAKLRSFIWIREEVRRDTCGEFWAPHFTLAQMEQCRVIGLFPSDRAILILPSHPIICASKISRSEEICSLVDDETVLDRLDQFMIRPDLLAQMRTTHDQPIFATLLDNQIVISGSFLPWALTDRARAGPMSKEQEMRECYGNSDLDMPTSLLPQDAVDRLVEKLTEIFGEGATTVVHSFLRIYAGTSAFSDTWIIAELPEMYREMNVTIFRDRSNNQEETLPGLRYPSQVIHKIEIRHPALLREIQVYQARTNPDDGTHMALFPHVTQYHFECVRGMLTHRGVYLTFAAAASLIHGKVTSPFLNYLLESVPICHKYLARGFQIHYAQELHCPELIDALGEEIQFTLAEPRPPLLTDEEKDAIFASLGRTRPKNGYR